MKRVLLTVALFICMTGLHLDKAHSQDRPTNREIGIIVGEPTGISAKFWTGPTTAFNLGVAWAFGGQGSLHIHTDYIIHHRVEEPEVDLYYGLGGRLLMRDDVKLGARIPLGLQYNIPDTRLSVFFELVPMLNLTPSTEFDVNGGIGIRYFF